MKYFHSGVHKRLEVLFFPDVEHKLTLNIKYYFYSNIGQHLLYHGFERMVRSICLDWHFRNKPDNLSFDPKLPYSKSTWEPSQDARHIEDGIRRGQMELLS